MRIQSPDVTPTGQGRTLKLLCVAVGGSFVTHSMVAPLVPLMAISLGASAGLVGVIVSAAYVLPLFFAVPAGRFADRIGSRQFLVGGMLGFVVAPVAVVMVPTLAVLAAAQAVVGLGQLAIGLASQSLIAAHSDRLERERWFGWYSMTVSAGQLVGPVLAGALLDFAGFRVAFGVAASVAVASTAASLVVPDSSDGRGPVEVIRERFATRSLFLNRGMQMALVVSAGLLFAVSAYQAFLPVYLAELGYTGTFIGVLFSLRAFTAMLVRPFISRVATLFGARSSAFAVMLLLVAAGVGLTGLVEGRWYLIAFAVSIGIGSGITPPLSMVAVVDHVSRGLHSTALGLRLSGNRLAQLVSPLLLGAVGEALGVRYAFVGGGLAVLLFILMLLRLRVPFEAAEAEQGR